MRSVNGMHISNARHWYVEDQIAASKKRGAMTILHHLMFEYDALAQQWGDVENQYWFCKLRSGWQPQGIPPAPERLIHVRMFHPVWVELDPKQWAEHTVRMLERVSSGGRVYNLWEDPFVCVSLANEQNLHYEAGDSNPGNQPIYRSTQWYEKIAAWNLAAWREIDRLIPGRHALACWSALAYGHDPDGNDTPDSEYQIPAIREAIEYCDIGASHPYGHLDWANGKSTVPGGEDAFYHMLRPFRPEGWRDSRKPSKPHDPGGELAQFPGKPWLFTEAGTFSHSNRGLAARTLMAMRFFLSEAAKSGQALGATWFIGSSDDAHKANNIGANPELRRELADLEEYQTRLEVPRAREHVKPPIPEPDYTDAYEPYTLQPGDTLYGVARAKLGKGQRYRELMRVVAMGDVTRLPIGTVVMVPKE